MTQPHPWTLPENVEKLKKLSERDLRMLMFFQKWRTTRRAKQTPPEGLWSEFGILAGRGFGKTVTGSHWILEAALLDPLAAKNPSAIIAPTLNDVRYTSFEGPTGILSILPPELLAKDGYNRTNLIVTLDNGHIIRGFSAEEPERLRGPQFCRVLCEEIAAWQKDQETWDMMQMGLRLGPNPQVMWITTPKPKEFIRKLVQPQDRRIIYNGSTYDNRSNLPDSFFKQLTVYEGTTLGRQELNGELIDGEEGGIISRNWLKLWPAKTPLPTFDYIVVSLDTAFTEKAIDKRTQTADPTACTVWGGFWHEDKRAILLLDCWDEMLGLPALIKKAKSEMKVAYGTDEDKPLIRPMIGPNRTESAGRKPDILLIEDKGSGRSLIQMLAQEGVSAHAYNPGRADKTARLHIVSHIFARGQVFVPESERNPGKLKSWAEPFVNQLCAYSGPGSTRHDDYIDTATQAIRLFIDKQLLTEEKRDKPRERDDEAREQAPRGPYANPYAI
jgi:predicted phage terminase large subunit-like protein